MNDTSQELYDASDALQQAARALEGQQVGLDDEVARDHLVDEMRDLAVQLSAWAYQLEQYP